MTDDIDIVRRFFAAWTAGDLEALLALVDPDVVVIPLGGLLYEQRSYRGHEGMVEAFTEIAERWDRFEIRVEGMRRDGDQVIAVIRWVVTKHDMSSDAEVAVTCTVRDGLIVALTEPDERTPHPAARRR